MIFQVKLVIPRQYESRAAAGLATIHTTSQEHLEEANNQKACTISSHPLVSLKWLGQSRTYWPPNF